MGQDPFTVLPLTFHTRKGLKDPQFAKFAQYYQQLDEKIKAMEKEQKAAISEIKLRKAGKNKGHEYD